MELACLYVLFFLTLAFSYLPREALARGGERNPEFSVPMDHIGRLFSRHLFEEREPHTSETLVQGYMTNSDLEKTIMEYGQRCGNISTIYSIGRSVNGVPLWVIEISNKPGKEEPEPAFKFIGNVHGDEPVGRELLILLANWLCDNYKKDSLATMIIDNFHLHILPTMNPDGFALRQRGNANNVDLNRDFPDQFYPMNDIVDLRQPETRAIMSWVKERRFTASASLHGGALVANYPWDGSQDTRKNYSACPDDTTFRYLASLYSRFHYNMSLSKEFEGGITNGALWYPIFGGMQDWNYIHGGCFELTLEVSDVKWPKANELPVLWEYNRASMLHLVAGLGKMQVHGRVLSNTGHPLSASVVIKGIDYKVNASRSFGDYHRILAPENTYGVMASMTGFKSKATNIVLKDEAVSLDFVLEPEEGGTESQAAGKNWDCSCDDNNRLQLVQFLKEAHVAFYSVVVIIVLLFLFLLKRKTLFKFRKQLQSIGHKRPIVI